MLKNLIKLIASNDNESLNEFLHQYYAVDLVSIIKALDNNQLEKFCNLTNDQEMSQLIKASNIELQKRLLSDLETLKIVNILNLMSPDDVVDILGELSINIRKDIIRLLKKDDSNSIELLLGYGKETAGGIMTTRYIALKNTMSIEETLDKIKRIGPKTEIIEVLYVTNDKNELIGTADLRDVLLADSNLILEDICNRNVISVLPDIDREEVSLIVSKYDLKAIPVINSNNAIMGIITLDDIIDVIYEEQTEDLLMLSGVNKKEIINNKLITSISRRLPWLLVNMLTVFLAAYTVSLFNDVIAQVVIIASALPIVAGMGGNSGNQVLSVVIRNIALGRIELRTDWKIVFKEMLLGVINGLATGLVAGIVLSIRYNNIYFGIIILISMILNMLIANSFGFLIPLILKKLKVDPALASSMFLTTATDVFGFFIYLSLAKEFLPYLI